MTTEAVSLELTPREVLGKNVKRLRWAGIIPVHLYGPGVEPRSLQCETQTLIAVLAKAGGNTPINITIQGEPGTQLAFAREIQWEPKRDDLLHVDFLVAEATRMVSAQVPIVLVGESPGARTSGGTVMHQLRNMSVEALPLEMPGELEVDLTQMVETDAVVRAGDIRLPAGVNMLTDPEEVVVRIEALRAVVEVEEGEVAEEVEEGAPGEPGAEETTEGDSGGAG